MNFYEIMNRIKEINDSKQISGYFEGEFLRIIRNVDIDLYNTFFTDQPRDCNFDFYNGYIPNLKELAVKFVSYIISQIPEHGFNSAVTMNLPMLQQWYSNNERDLGLVMYKKFLLEVKDFGEYFNNSEQWSQIIEETMTSNEFVTGTEVQYLSQNVNLLYLLLFTLKLLDNGGQRFTRVVNFYRQWMPTSYAVSRIHEYQWFYVFKQQGEVYRMSQYFYGYVSTLLTSLETKNTMDFSGNISGVSNTYGEKALEWLNSDNGPRLYNIRSQQNPSNVSQPNGGLGGNGAAGGAGGDLFGCVVKGTQILMCDGTNKAIENIKEWDKVSSESGGVSTCSDELICNNKLTRLYAINNDEPFMSLDHAVKTQRGWCSLNPDISNEINGNYNVKKLEIGDTVYKVERIENGVVNYSEERVENINVKEFTKGEIQAHDIHFREGSMSYHCNGYLCLLNYPEITGKRISENMNNQLTEDERASFMALITDNLTIFEKVFGRQAIDYFNLY